MNQHKLGVIIMIILKPIIGETKLMSQVEAANYLNTSVGVLNTWRCTGKQKIPHIKWGRKIRYRKEDLDAWIESQSVNSLIQPNN
jgi:excisionase family DNA binding protein